MQKIVKEFGERVKKVRLGKNMSQNDVAKILGTHRVYISGIERGMRNPSLITMEKIAKALGVKINDLIDK
jgi:transcriptional regulator with XRE-family HTH domain